MFVQNADNNTDYSRVRQTILQIIRNTNCNFTFVDVTRAKDEQFLEVIVILELMSC